MVHTDAELFVSKIQLPRVVHLSSFPLDGFGRLLQNYQKILHLQAQHTDI